MLTPDFLIPFGNYSNTAVFPPEMWKPTQSHIEPNDDLRRFFVKFR